MNLILVTTMIFTVLLSASCWKIRPSHHINSVLVTCAAEINASSKLRAQWSKFKFPTTKEPNKSECFIRCIFDKLELLKDSRLNKSRLYKQLEGFIAQEKRTKFKNHINGCIHEFKGHSCKKVFQVFFCLQLGFKKEMQKAFTPMKKIPAHTEL